MVYWYGGLKLKTSNCGHKGINYYENYIDTHFDISSELTLSINTFTIKFVHFLILLKTFYVFGIATSFSKFQPTVL